MIDNIVFWCIALIFIVSWFVLKIFDRFMIKESKYYGIKDSCCIDSNICIWRFNKDYKTNYFQCQTCHRLLESHFIKENSNGVPPVKKKNKPIKNTVTFVKNNYEIIQEAKRGILKIETIHTFRLF